MANTTAGKVRKRQHRLLKAIGAACEHKIGYKCGPSVKDILASDAWLKSVYPPDSEHTAPDEDNLLYGDIALLEGRHKWITYEMAGGGSDGRGGYAPGPFAQWQLTLTAAGLEALVEIEKSPIRRAYDKSPPAWWQVALTAIAVGVSIWALFRAYNPPTPQPPTTNAADGSRT